MAERADRCPACGRPVICPGDTAEGPGWRLWCGRSEDLLQTLPRGSVDMVLTDPPYGSGGNTLKARMEPTGKKYTFSRGNHQSALPDFAGDSIHPEAWTAMQTAVWSECARVLAPAGVFACLMDWRQAPWMTRILAAAGLRVRGQVGWNKGPSARPVRGGFRQQEEYILWGSAGSGRLPRSDVYLPGVLCHKSLTAKKRHETEKPRGLMHDLLQICPPGGLVLDPFAGSGTTLEAGLMAGYQVLGIEQLPAIWATARARLEEMQYVPEPQQSSPA